MPCAEETSVQSGQIAEALYSVAVLQLRSENEFIIDTLIICRERYKIIISTITTCTFSH